MRKATKICEMCTTRAYSSSWLRSQRSEMMTGLLVLQLLRRVCLSNLPPSLICIIQSKISPTLHKQVDFFFLNLFAVIVKASNRC